MKKGILRLFVFCFFILSVTVFTSTNYIDQKTIETVQKTLLKKHGDQNRFRIERGVKQTSLFWTKEDGNRDEFLAFCQKYFISSPEVLESNFKRLETFSEVINGYYTEMILDLRRPLDLDWGEIMPIDMVFGQYNPASHVSEDFFKNKIAFIVLLNFPHYSLDELIIKGEIWNRREWAYARTGNQFSSRTPAMINQKISNIMTQSDTYIAQYNIFMGKLIDEQMKSYFPEKLKLITHWGIRDELKSRYKDPQGLFKQKMIYKVMERIIKQEIPEKVINNASLQWNPFSNKVYKNGKEVAAGPEPDTRYQNLLDVFKAIRMADQHNPFIPNFIKRRFESNREIPEAEVETLFKELLSSKEVKKVTRLIRRRLKRRLHAFDIWYPGFKSLTKIPEEELDKIVSKKYPNTQAFETGIEEILVKLGWTKERAKFIAGKIQVDASRGAGHAAGAAMKTAKSRLRTRVPKGGMNYKGFNIAVHELGHTVEQTLTLHDVDYYALNGVPNAAFTECFAYIFQDRDLDILGIKRDKTHEHHLKTLDIFWNAYEIMGVSLVDMKAWNWMYQHPDATPAQLKAAIISIAKEIWNKYYAPVFRIKDQPILAIYSHMIAYPLYLPDYAIGHIIQFQIEDWMKDKNIAQEMERLCATGNIIPQLWMKKAVGSKISVKPLLKAVNQALKYIKK